MMDGELLDGHWRREEPLDARKATAYGVLIMPLINPDAMIMKGSGFSF